MESHSGRTPTQVEQTAWVFDTQALAKGHRKQARTHGAPCTHGACAAQYIIYTCSTACLLGEVGSAEQRAQLVARLRLLHDVYIRALR